jgi:hypothetical protein
VIASDPVADAVDAAELLDVDMDQLARPLALVADHRRLRLERGEPSEPETAHRVEHSTMALSSGAPEPC